MTTQEVYDQYEVERGEPCGDGWAPILDALFRDLIATGFKPAWVAQVKEKFGGLRIYIHPDDDTPLQRLSLWATRIQQAERESYRTCEVCGQPGELRDLTWYRTLCTQHYEERLAKQQADAATRKAE